MSKKGSFSQGAVWVAGGEALCQILTFLRNAFIARFVSPEDFGVAATFALALTLFEMLSNLAVDKFLIQSATGNEPASQYTAQLIELGRNCANAVALILVAGPLARTFGDTGLTWAFGVLATVPFLRGLTNLDVYRIQREMKFSPLAGIEIASSVASTLAAVPLGYYLKDYSAMLYVVILKTCVFVVSSHLVSTRSYRLAFEPRVAKDIWHFGWPLIANGLVMFAIYQGDRFIIASGDTFFPNSKFGLNDLGFYAVGFALATSVTEFLSKISNTLLLPLFSTLHSDSTTRRMVIERLALLSSTIGSGVCAFFIIVGARAVVFVYGPQYAAIGPLIGWIGAAQGLRLLRVAPISALLASGDTRGVLIANLVRSGSLIATAVIAHAGGVLESVAIAAFVAEAVAVIYCAQRIGWGGLRGWVVAFLVYASISLLSCWWKTAIGADEIVLELGGLIAAGVAASVVFLHGAKGVTRMLRAGALLAKGED
jgi:O-antigen/teichoic acid export membrane protein